MRGGGPNTWASVQCNASMQYGSAIGVKVEKYNSVISEGYNYRVPQNISSAICNSIVQSAIYTLSITVHEVGEGTMDRTYTVV